MQTHQVPIVRDWEPETDGSCPRAAHTTAIPAAPNGGSAGRQQRAGEGRMPPTLHAETNRRPRKPLARPAHGLEVPGWNGQRGAEFRRFRSFGSRGGVGLGEAGGRANWVVEGSTSLPARQLCLQVIESHRPPRVARGPDPFHWSRHDGHEGRRVQILLRHPLDVPGRDGPDGRRPIPSDGPCRRDARARRRRSGSHWSRARATAAIPPRAASLGRG